MIFETLFDRVVVLSLPSSVDRREHIQQHFNDIGLAHYEFHDACGIDHPDVKELYDKKLVAQYPPCFRCGKLECGQPDCNNVLIPQQVAVFATYLNLWRRLKGHDERVLVCEDDVFFHPWTESVLTKLANQITSGDFSFSGKVPTLLRLGWAASEEHDGSQPFRIGRDIRMSNPCHAITSAYARRLLEAFDGVRHTPDVFQNRLAPVARDHAFTIFPPIASELSWSAGVFESLIHPKDVFAQQLEENGRIAEAEAYRQYVSNHFSSVAHRKIDSCPES